MSDTSPKEITTKLDQIFNAILPLHELLRVLERQDQDLSERLEEILKGFLAVATQMKGAAQALTALAEVDSMPPAQAIAFRTLEARLSQLDARTSEIQSNLQTMMQWFGAVSEAEQS